MSRGVLFEDLVGFPGLWADEEDEVGDDRAENDPRCSDALYPVDGEGEIEGGGSKRAPGLEAGLTLRDEDGRGIVHKGANQDPNAHEQKEFLGGDSGTAGPNADNPSASERKQRGGCDSDAHRDDHGAAKRSADPGEVAACEGFAEGGPKRRGYECLGDGGVADEAPCDAVGGDLRGSEVVCDH